jgi:hypothetical protein
MIIFWQRWLTLWCVGVGMFGLILFGVGFSSTTPVAAVIFSAFGNPLPAEPDRYLRFAISLMGAVTAGWAVTYYAAFKAAWALEGAASTTIWRLLSAGAVAWYLIDSFASIANGFGLNALSNTVLMVAYLVPVLRSGVLSRSPHPPETRL